MGKSELKQKLIDQIQLINDDETLHHIEQYISLNFPLKSTYQLDEDDLEALKVSDVEFEQKEYTNHEDLREKIKKWF
jgi:hypothetical protein